MRNIDRVRTIVAEALYIELENVQPDMSLVNDLGAESIDFLDIIFRIEKEFGVKVDRSQIMKAGRGNLTEQEFMVNGVVQPLGLENLRQALPEVNSSKIAANLKAHDIPKLFTVTTFLKMAESQLRLVANSSSVSIDLVEAVEQESARA